MGQIVSSAAKPRRCNLQSLSQLGTPAAGEYILVSSDNSMNAAGQGIFDCYIVGDGTTAATALELIGIEESGSYTTREEWIRVVTDAEGRILYGVKTDGEFVFGVGIPQSIKDYVLSQKAEVDADVLAEKTRAMAAESALGTAKVDKEEGKSLIDAEYASSQSVIDNPEYLQVTTDSDDKILEGIKQDGTKIFGADVKVLGSLDVNGVSYSVISNPEWIACWVDDSNKIVFGFKTDGKTFVGDANFLDAITSNATAISEINNILSNTIGYTNIDWDALKCIKTADNPEYIDVELDSDDKILGGRRKNGRKFENVGIDTPDIHVGGNLVSTDEDVENRQTVVLDSENKILSYRDKSGKLYEEAGVKTNFLEVKDCKVDSLNGKIIPMCDKEDVVLNRPAFASIHFYGGLPTDNSASRTPTTLEFVYKDNDVPVLRGYGELSIQGHGSASFAKKGYTFDVLNKNKDALKIKFGNMIATDSFHLKAYMTDVTHSHDVGSANLWKAMMKQLSYPTCKINNKIYDPTDLSVNEINIADATYAVDGFPVSLYINDDFHGLYTIRLKKTRENYALDKSDKNQIFLDSITYSAYLDRPFNHSDWELKNPKIKNYEEGGEITDAGVLSTINNLFDFLSNIDTRYSEHEDFIVLDSWLVYCIFIELIGHLDSVGNNTDILTWDNQHWVIVPYDMDISLGITPSYENSGEWGVLNQRTGFLIGSIFGSMRTIYADRIKTIYRELRNSKFLTVQNIMTYYTPLMASIPRDIYKKDRAKWGNIYVSGYPTIEQMQSYINSRINFLDSEWLTGE